MPGPVSDSYDPEFSTGANAQEVCDAVAALRDRVTEALGTSSETSASCGFCVLR